MSTVFKYIAEMRYRHALVKTQRVYMLVANIQAGITLFILYFFWLKVYEGKSLVNGFTFSQIVTYYFLMRVCYNRISAFAVGGISKDIVTGKTTHELLKPVNIILSKVAKAQVSANLWALGNLFIIGLFSFYFVNIIYIQTKPLNLILFLVTFIFNGILSYYINFAIGIMAFWITEVTHLKLIATLVISFLAGATIPYSFMPSYITNVLNVLPFKYLISFPLDIYLDRIELNQIYSGILILIAWVVVLHVLCSYIFNKGIKSYEAFN